MPAMRFNAGKVVIRFVVFAALFSSAIAAQSVAPAAALNADYWRGAWRTPLGDAPHIYYFVIRGDRVSGVYCRSCSDATTMGFIDGTWSEKAGTKPAGKRNATALTLDKDPRGADPGGAPAYYLPPGTPPAVPTARPAGGGGGAPRPAAPYWQPGPFKALRPADVVGTWTGFGPLGMDKQIFTFLLVGNRLRGVVCGRCDNPFTTAAIEDIFIAGDTLYFAIAHQDWGEINPPTFDRHIAAHVVQNEMIAAILGTNMKIDPANPPAFPAGRPFTLVGPIAPEGTRGNSSEGVDVWGPGTGSAVQPPPGRATVRRVNPSR